MLEPADLIGAMLMNRYRIEQCIGRGGMASVYRARDQRLLRDVCVKVFMGWNPALPAYRTVHQHFIQEAFALSQLGHPNILRIYDFGYLDYEPRSPYFVSELLEDGTLREYVHAKQNLDAHEIFDILQPVCSALTEAHQQGLVHRDIKPSNILFGHAGDLRIIKLADFGIAKAFDRDSGGQVPNRAEDTNALANGIHMYSASWCAPEQLVGEVAGAPTDGFALGLLTAFMFTGKRVFSSSLTQCLQSRLEGDLFFDRELPKMRIPPAIAAVIRRACRLDVSERYASAAQFAEAYRDALRSLDGEQAANSNSRPSGIIQRSSGDPPERPRKPTPSIPFQPEATVAAPSITEYMVHSLNPTALAAAGVPVRVLAASSAVDLGAADAPLPFGARLRLTLVSAGSEAMRVHLKGLNCFLQRQHHRPTVALDLREDTELGILSVDRSQRCNLRLCFGRDTEKGWYFLGRRAALLLPTALQRFTVLLEVGPDDEMILVHHSAAKGQP